MLPRKWKQATRTRATTLAKAAMNMMIAMIFVTVAMVETVAMALVVLVAMSTEASVCESLGHTL